MSTYRKEWPCCGSVTETESFEPPFCPICQQAEAAGAVRAAERERCAVLTDDMLRYAMAAMGTGSPRQADELRRFWRFAMEARDTGPNVRANLTKGAADD
jgi:hypothetical protein